MATDECNRTEDCLPPTWPENFGGRLERLKEISGLSWGQMAEHLGVTERGALKWRRGGRPSAANLLAILELARAVPDGYDLLFHGDDAAE